MAGSKAFLLEHLSYKLMITIPRHHTRHRMLHISIFIWVFCIRVLFVVVFVATFEVETISWSLGHSVENLDVETGDPWSEKPPMIPVRHRGNQSFAVYCICICICIVFVFVYVLFFVSLWWSTEPDTFLLSAFSAFNTSLIWIEREPRCILSPSHERQALWIDNQCKKTIRWNIKEILQASLSCKHIHIFTHGSIFEEELKNSLVALKCVTLSLENVCGNLWLL